MDGSYKLCSSAHTMTCVVQHVLPHHLHHMRKHGGGVILRHPVLAEGPVDPLVYSLLPGIGQVLALPVRMLGHRVPGVPAAAFPHQMLTSLLSLCN